MVFSDEMFSDMSPSSDTLVSVKEEVDSESELTASSDSTSPRPPSPPPAHTHNHSLNHPYQRRGHDSNRGASRSKDLMVGADPDTVILVSRDKRTGKREHILLKSLLKTQGGGGGGGSGPGGVAVPGRIEKRVIINRGPRSDFRSTSMGTRTQLRQSLDRQQMLEAEERDKQKAAAARQGQQQSQTIAMPVSFHEPEIPAKILQSAKTALQHPTKYHMVKVQQSQVKQYMNTIPDRNIPAHSMPNLALSSSSSVGNHWLSGSAPTDMEGATGLDEDMGLLEEIILENADYHQDSDLHHIEPSLTQMSSTLPQQSMYTQYNTLEVDTVKTTTSSSCPPVFQQLSPPTNMSEEEQRMWAKDRQKKDNHNMIERRRRFNINDRIKELGTLLPKTYDQDMRQNKGSILKASVDYIKRLKRDSDQLRAEKEQKAQLEKNLQKLQLKFTQLYAVAKQRDSSISMMEDLTSDMMVAPSSIINLQQTGMQPLSSTSEQQMSPVNPFSGSVLAQGFGGISTHCNFLEDNSPVNGDPMLTSAPVSPDNDDDSTF